jgi:MFS family permease
VGIELAPGGGWAWAALLGVGIGPLFPLTMTLPLDAADEPRQVAAFAWMMLGVGYTLSAGSPLVLGAVRDLSGSFGAVLWVLVGAAAALVLVDASFSRQRLGADRSSDKRPLAGASSWLGRSPAPARCRTLGAKPPRRSRTVAQVQKGKGVVSAGRGSPTAARLLPLSIAKDGCGTMPA